ncbi:MAG: hypothetical protein VR66_04215 [Peptococcaceae bacterium BRH_c23]|nr:MAG: hypothetical protein VR66_04215 [Peptococcaceae bacterium BRH_c23]KJS89763.1 MAG: hypothetical protein JL57_05745 [Desulfosporosinus sp. BICA1-9]
MTETKMDYQVLAGVYDYLHNKKLTKIMLQNLQEIGVPAPSEEDLEFAIKITETLSVEERVKVLYLTTSIGLVPVTIAPVDWTTPPLLGGWLATSSWRGLALQIFNIIIGTSLYYPFVKLYELQKRRAIINTYEQLVQTVLSEDYCTNKRILTRNDQIGNMANALSYDIQAALEKGEFFLEYQPQVDVKGVVLGVEALLRWNHFLYGRVNPQVVVAIAEEAGMINKLGHKGLGVSIAMDDFGAGHASLYYMKH